MEIGLISHIGLKKPEIMGTTLTHLTLLVFLSPPVTDKPGDSTNGPVPSTTTNLNCRGSLAMVILHRRYAKFSWRSEVEVQVVHQI
jgi:hypothetical protein